MRNWTLCDQLRGMVLAGRFEGFLGGFAAKLLQGRKAASCVGFRQEWTENAASGAQIGTRRCWEALELGAIRRREED